MVSQREQRSDHLTISVGHRTPNQQPPDWLQRCAQLEAIETELQAFYTHTYESVRMAFIENNFDRVVVDDDYHELERVAETIAAGLAAEAVGGWVDHVVTRILSGATRAQTFGPTCSCWSNGSQQVLVDWSCAKVSVLDITAWPIATAGGAR